MPRFLWVGRTARGPEQQRPAVPRGDARQANGRHDFAVVQGDERQMALMRTAFPDLVGGAGKPARTEGFLVDMGRFQRRAPVFPA